MKIWRYLDFTKFLSYLDKKALFFTRADKLDDIFEGKFTDACLDDFYNPPIFYPLSLVIWMDFFFEFMSHYF